eukprot:632904-Alexandrium_andersonii.AAC.1
MQASPKPGWTAADCAKCRCANAPSPRGSIGRSQWPPRPQEQASQLGRECRPQAQVALPPAYSRER